VLRRLPEMGLSLLKAKVKPTPAVPEVALQH
jgi:hypothetical protein